MSAVRNAIDLVTSATITLSPKPCILHRALSGCYFVNETEKRTIDTSDPQSSVFMAVNRVPLETCLYCSSLDATRLLLLLLFYLLLKEQNTIERARPDSFS